MHPRTPLNWSLHAAPCTPRTVTWGHTDREELVGGAVGGDVVVELVGGVEDAALGGVHEHLVRQLHRLELGLDLLLARRPPLVRCLLQQHRCLLVRVELEGRIPCHSSHTAATKCHYAGTACCKHPYVRAIPRAHLTARGEKALHADGMLAAFCNPRNHAQVLGKLVKAAAPVPKGFQD